MGELLLINRKPAGIMHLQYTGMDPITTSSANTSNVTIGGPATFSFPTTFRFQLQEHTATLTR